MIICCSVSALKIDHSANRHSNLRSKAANPFIDSNFSKAGQSLKKNLLNKTNEIVRGSKRHRPSTYRVTAFVRD